MKITLPDIKILRNFGKISLESVLGYAWRIIFVVFAILLAIDGAIFFFYGLGRVSPPPGEVAEVPAIEERAIHDAAVIIKARQTQFRATSSTPSDLPNPFR